MQKFLKSLEGNGQKFLQMLNFSKDLVFLMKLEESSFRYLFVNTSGLNALQCEEKDVIGKLLEEVVAPPLAKRLKQYYLLATQTKTPLEFEESNGNVIGETSLNPIFLSGNDIYVLAIVRDITDRVQKEKEFKQLTDEFELSQKKLYSLIKQNSEAVFELDLHGRIVNINESATIVSNYEFEDLEGKFFQNYIAKDDLDKVVSHFHSCLNGNTEEYEANIRVKNNKKLLLNIRNIPIIIDGEIVGIYGIGRDITKKRELEIQVEKIQKELEIAWDNASDGIFLLSDNGEILKVNPALTEMLGYRKSEMENIDVPKYVPDNLVNLYFEALDEMKKGKAFQNIEIQLKTRTNQFVDALVSFKPINKNGILAVGMLKNITERKKTIDRLVENEKQYRRLVDLSPTPIIVHQKNKIIYINHSGMKLLGDRDILQKSIYTIIPSDEDNNFCQETNGHSVLQNLALHDGRVIHTEIISTKIEFDGKPAIQTILQDVSEKLKKKEELEFMAYHDPLTGLKNRRAFIDYLDNAITNAKENEKMLAVIYLDMDEFKDINDTYGHGTGDDLLIQAAERLIENSRETDVICRIGGDEFLILLDHISKKEEVLKIADRLYHATQEVYEIQNKKLAVTTSFGISLYPNDAMNAKLLILHADQALYKAKEQKNKYAFYESQA